MERKEFIAIVADACQRYETTMAHAFRAALGIERAEEAEAPRAITEAEFERAERKRRKYESLMRNRYGVLERVR